MAGPLRGAFVVVTTASLFGVAGTAAAASGGRATAEVGVAGVPARVPDGSATRKPSPPAPAVKAIAFAKAQIGKPFVWGGTGPRGFDCSGLVRQAFASAGIKLPRGSVAQSSKGHRVTRGQLRPGDLIFSNGFDHVQLYVGEGKIVEAAHHGTSVRLVPMLPTWMSDAYVRIS